jgi:hypothetical protein
MGAADQFLAVAAVAGRVCVGLVFLLAVAQKMRHWRVLSGVIANYRILPRWAVAPATALLPPLELLVAVLLLSALAMPWVLLAAIALLALFAAAMAINLRRGRADIDCGCGRPSLKQRLRWTLVGRNLLLAALLLPSLALTGPVTSLLVASGVAAGLAFFLLSLVVNLLSALPHPVA